MLMVIGSSRSGEAVANPHRYPAARPSHQPSVKGNALGALLDRYGLTAEVTSLAPGSQPHRALWDTAGTALLLPALIDDSVCLLSEKDVFVNSVNSG